MTDILDLPDWTLLAKRQVEDEYELDPPPPVLETAGAVGLMESDE